MNERVASQHFSSFLRSDAEGWSSPTQIKFWAAQSGLVLVLSAFSSDARAQHSAFSNLKHSSYSAITSLVYLQLPQVRLWTGNLFSRILSLATTPLWTRMPRMWLRLFTFARFRTDCAYSSRWGLVWWGVRGYPLYYCAWREEWRTRLKRGRRRRGGWRWGGRRSVSCARFLLRILTRLIRSSYIVEEIKEHKLEVDVRSNRFTMP